MVILHILTNRLSVTIVAAIENFFNELVTKKVDRDRQKNIGFE
jgi:hypothetical protein